MAQQPLNNNGDFVQELDESTDEEIVRSTGLFQAAANIFLFPFSLTMTMFNRIWRAMTVGKTEPEVVRRGRHAIAVKRRSWFKRAMLSILPRSFLSFLSYSNGTYRLYLTEDVRMSRSTPDIKGSQRNNVVHEDGEAAFWSDISEEAADWIKYESEFEDGCRVEYSVDEMTD